MITAEGLSNALYAKMDAAYGIPPQGEGETKKYLKIFAEGIVEYLKANIDVLPGTFAIPDSGSVIGMGKIT